MPELNSLYQGREQSQVKHFILRQYLTSMAFKVVQSSGRSPTPINYVDGFSGPWGTRDTSDYSDTSFGLAIDVLKRVRDEMQRIKHIRPPVRFVFCEEDPESHE